MKDLSLHIIELTKNAIRANASSVSIEIIEEYDKDTLQLKVSDNGDGIALESLPKVTDAFYTTKTTQKVGLGLALLKQNAEEASGKVAIESNIGEGTTILAQMKLSDYDCLPVGDLVAAMTTLLQKQKDVHFQFSHQIDQQKYSFASNEITADRSNEEEVRSYLLKTIANNVINL